MTIAADENGAAPGQHRRNASVTADKLSLLWERVIADGTPLCATTVRKLVNAVPRMKAGSCEPNRCHAVPSQRAIEMGNFLGNSKAPPR